MGDLKAKETVPLLLKRLEWQYAHCVFPEEEYPAVYALCKIGEPSAKAILPLLDAERNPLRRELMIFVLLKVQGREKVIATLRNMIGEAEKEADNGGTQAAERLKILRTDYCYASTLPEFVMELVNSSQSAAKAASGNGR